MLILLQTHSISWAESVRLALLAEGIEAVVLDQASPGTLGVAGSIRVAIANDDDLPRASKIVLDLQPPKSEPPPSWWWHKRGCLSFSVGWLLLFAAQMSESGTSHIVKVLLPVVSVVLVTGGLVLILFGYRADKRQSKKQ